MATRKNWLGILVITLIFGMTAIGCDDGGGGGDSTSELTELTGGLAYSAPYGGLTLKVGNTINIFTDRLGGTGTISYFWYRNNEQIYGANNSSYTLTENDAGKLISVKVSRSGNTGTVGMSFDNVVLPSTAPDLTGTVSIDGLLKVGQTLTANTENLNGTGTIFYQWMSETTTGGYSWYPSDTNSTFTLTSDTIGKRIRLVVYRTGYYKTIEYTTGSAVTTGE